MRFTLLLLSLATLAACQPSDAVPSSRSEPSPTAGTDPGAKAPDAANGPASLVGDYRVAGVDGAEVGGGIGIALSITGESIAYEPRCAGFVWRYAYESGRVTTDRPQKPGPRLTAGPRPPICEIAVDPELVRLAVALDAVTRAARTPSNGIELTGKGHSVTLYSQ